ncbi:saccharopine dehydrogenase related protein [Fructilactobacillus fructivorans]|uniref:NAD(P)H-binding protein n=1 Tax=Fructilactobacillus fructivorans TaxID=1614 RepID=UPI00070519B8|nr:NAD(P)H-binding protein [Fructilactobacillus fructivorans]KRN13204.1 saccharopine dehydrogenase related protein [Fructilactobacillus fructivorans]
MKNILLLGKTQAEQMVFNYFNSKNEFKVHEITTGGFTQEQTYRGHLKDVDVIVSFLGPLDVDLDMEALFSVIYSGRLNPARIIFLSAAGIDKEVDGELDYPGVDDVSEFLKQQQYAIKVIDESEIPYTIFRLVNVVNTKHNDGHTIEEGQPVPVGIVSHETIAHFVIDAIVNGSFKNQSQALVEERSEREE